MKTAPRLEGREGLGTEEGKAGSGILWEFLAGRAPEVSSAFLPCLPGDLSGSSQPRSVRSWPPPHTQGQQEPPQAFLAAANGGTRGAFQLLVSDREWWVRCPACTPPPGGPQCGPQDMERAWAPAAEGLAFLPSLPPSPCIVLIRPCSSTGVLPVLTREKCGQAGEKPSSVRAPPPVPSKGGRGAPAPPPITG